jgi:hypothetical protein
MTRRFTAVAGISAVVIAVALLSSLTGGCPTGALTSLVGGLLTDPNTPAGVQTSGTDTTGAGTTTTAGGSGTGTGTTGDTSGTTTGGAGTETGTGTGTGGTETGGNEAVDAINTDGFTGAAIIHRAAGGFPADPKYGIPAGNTFASDGSIKSSVRIPHVSKDGSTIWFATQDGNGFVTPQLFCINSDGTGLQEIPLPLTDINRVPVELWPSADGQVCALLIDTGQGTDFSVSTIQIADRRTGQITLLYDGRNIPDGNNDFEDVQITDDGSTIYFKNIETSIISSIPASGGSLATVSTLADYTRSASTARGIIRYRINGDASALIVNVWFYGPNSTYPADYYLKTNTGVTALTSTGDAPQSFQEEYMGVSDDQRYVVYRRFSSSQSRYSAYILDRNSGQTTTLGTGAGGYATLLDSAGTVVFTAFATGRYYGGIDQLPGLSTLDGSSVLQLVEGWADDTNLQVPFTSMSAGADVLVGTWANGAFGDPSRLYAWFANTTSYRDGPSITAVSYKLDSTAGTLSVRAAVQGTVTVVGFLGMYDNFESWYQLTDDADPFENERFGSEMTASSTAGIYELTSALNGLTLNEHYRIRITAGDNGAKNFAYVDFRPVPVAGETVDINGDAVAD